MGQDGRLIQVLNSPKWFRCVPILTCLPWVFLICQTVSQILPVSVLFSPRLCHCMAASKNCQTLVLRPFCEIALLLRIDDIKTPNKQTNKPTTVPVCWDIVPSTSHFSRIWTTSLCLSGARSLHWAVRRLWSYKTVWSINQAGESLCQYLNMAWGWCHHMLSTRDF